MRTKKNTNYRIEEAGTGKPSETCLLVIHPLADIDEIAESCHQMNADYLKQIWIVIDKRCSTLHVQDSMKVVRDVMPNLEHVIRFAQPFIIRLIFELWQEMKQSYEKMSRRRCGGCMMRGSKKEQGLEIHRHLSQGI